LVPHNTLQGLYRDNKAARRYRKERSKMKKADSTKRKRIEFRLHTESGTNIFVAGTFNNWSPTIMKQKDKGAGFYGITLTLSVGRHEYKFVVAENPETVQNAFGSMNSIITIA
jgi:1,4-alpha-glucan branching enzyme